MEVRGGEPQPLSREDVLREMQEYQSAFVPEQDDHRGWREVYFNNFSQQLPCEQETMYTYIPKTLGVWKTPYKDIPNSDSQKMSERKRKKTPEKFHDDIKSSVVKALEAYNSQKKTGRPMTYEYLEEVIHEHDVITFYELPPVVEAYIDLRIQGYSLFDLRT